MTKVAPKVSEYRDDHLRKPGGGFAGDAGCDTEDRRSGDQHCQYGGYRDRRGLQNAVRRSHTQHRVVRREQRMPHTAAVRVSAREREGAAPARRRCRSSLVSAGLRKLRQCLGEAGRAGAHWRAPCADFARAGRQVVPGYWQWSGWPGWPHRRAGPAASRRQSPSMPTGRSRRWRRSAPARRSGCRPVAVCCGIAA